MKLVYTNHAPMVRWLDIKWENKRWVMPFKWKLIKHFKASELRELCNKGKP